MNIIEVIPITKGLNKDTLSYFTSKEISVGSIVNVPLRNKKVTGIVISINKAEDMKAEIKKADFTLKKVDNIKSTRFLDQAFMKMAKKVSEYHATSISSIIDTLVPDYILKNIDKLDKGNISERENANTKIIKEKYAVQGDDEERYGTWKSLIRQEFAKKKSVFFLLPTIEDAMRTYELLEKGVEGYAFMLHGGMNAKEIIDVWNKIIKENHPIAIISTGGFFSLPRNDIETIVIERESSKSYKLMRRPFIDIRFVAETFAEENNMKVFFADNLLRMETLWRESEGDIIEASPFKWRSLSTAKDTLIDMKKYKNETDNFKVISDEVENLIQKTKNESEQIAILVARRGVSPSTVCGDCQSIVLCNNCSSPVVLHKNFFMCHRCGERRSAEEMCKTCGSWKLQTMGIGIDLVIEKIKEKFPDITIFKIDSDSIKNQKQARNTIQKFKAKPGSVLVGTEMMLQYLHEKIENSAIISLDSLFALPDFRIQEKILYTLIRMRSITTKHFIVQTRKIDERIFEYGLKGNMSDFYRNEINERKNFNYPPFSTLIKITIEGKKENIIKEMEEVQNVLDPFEVEVFPAFTQTVRGNQVLHGLIRIADGKWPNIDLLSKLNSLPLSITIKVDPETLL